MSDGRAPADLSAAANPVDPLDRALAASSEPPWERPPAAVDARDGSSDLSSRHEDPEQALRALVRTELETPVRDNVEWLAGKLRARHGETVLGVLFYGSCLRKQTDEGVLDFWVVVDDYREAHASRLHALANRFAPPSVYSLEQAHAGQTLRTKYGVIDRRAFAAGTAFGACGEGFIRCSYATGLDDLKIAAERIAAFVDGLRS